MHRVAALAPQAVAKTVRVRRARVAGAPLRLAQARGEREQARALGRQELDLARAFGAPRAVGIALRTTAMTDDSARGVGLLEEAEALLQSCGAHLEEARAVTARGAALRRANQRAAARQPLQRGLELALLWKPRSRAACPHRADGDRGAAARVFRSGVQALTPSELRVARMAAEGMSNAAIAQALCVTPKTVEMHLSHVYSKLALSSRTALRLALEMA